MPDELTWEGMDVFWKGTTPMTIPNSSTGLLYYQAPLIRLAD